MSNTSIQLKKSGATGNTPTGLAYGEVAINYADGKLYYKNALGGTSYISNQFSFDTINANNSLILATGVSDTLSFVAGNNISISTNTTTKTITINSTGGSDTYARDTANAAFQKANNALANTNGATFGGDLNVTGKLSVVASSGDEGGEIFLAQAQSNTTLSGGITVDSYQNKIRFFEQGGSARGAYIDLTECVGGAGTNLLNPGATPDSTARATANAAFLQANAAYASQNTTGTYANSAYTQANTATNNAAGASLYANAAFIQANAAFDKANTGGGSASFIFSGTSNVYFSGANGSIIANVAGNTIFSITANGITTAGASGDISGANNIYANTIISTNAAIIAGVNVVPFIENSFNQANTANSNAITAGSYANSAFAVANTDVTNISITAGTYGGTTAIPIVTVAANGRVTAVTNAAITATGSFINNGTSNVYFSGANGSIIANVAGNTIFSITANGITTAGSSGDISGANNIYANAIYVVNATATNTFFANSVTFNDGTKLISASGIVASNAATANVAINARITNVTTGTYFPIVTDTTITGADTFHYSSNDFLMYAANNTFRATGNVWAGQFLTVGTNIPVVNSTGHWVGQTVNGIDSFARTTANAALPTTGGTVTGNLTLSTTSTMIIQNTRTSTSNSTGALIVRGGVGIAGNLFVGGIFTVDGDFQVGNTTSTGNVFNSGFVTFSQPTLFTSNAASTSNITGAIIVSGGAGIKGNIHSGSITITGPTSNGITFADATFQNTAFTSSVYNTLNVTTSTANTALAKAQSAYDLANTTTSLSIITDKFVANGNTTTFTLSTTPVTENFVTLVVDGVTQMRDTYSISGNVVTFNSTFENTANIEATTITGQGTISGATGGGTDRVFQVNETIITQPYTLTALRGASSVGPIAINDGVAVTLEDGARWVIL
jgi:hypothetical protein